MKANHERQWIRIGIAGGTNGSVGFSTRIPSSYAVRQRNVSSASEWVRASTDSVPSSISFSTLFGMSPECGTIHIDEGEFATKPHHTHACQRCGNVWRPAVVATVGVRFLPGFKNGVLP